MDVKSEKNETMPPETRKAVRLAIAAHLTQGFVTNGYNPVDYDMMVDRAYSLADKLLDRSGT